MPMSNGNGASTSLELIAYSLGGGQARLVPASHERDWMSSGMNRGPYRCLPLSIANSSGWILLNEQAFTATWDGGPAAGSTKLVFATRREGGYHATSVFGNGIVTFFVPFLFRTPPGYNLLVRGPANMPKDGVAPLEGVVETDWATATFTMNWQITRPGAPILFEADEPICMIVPQRRGELASFRPVLSALEPDSDLGSDHRSWYSSRSRFLRMLNRRLCAPDGERGGWQRHYFQGFTVDGSPAPEHETKVRLCPFED
jgi:hypothetical protein